MGYVVDDVTADGIPSFVVTDLYVPLTINTDETIFVYVVLSDHVSTVVDAFVTALIYMGMCLTID